jgi:hypothetical protein
MRLRAHGMAMATLGFWQFTEPSSRVMLQHVQDAGVSLLSDCLNVTSYTLQRISTLSFNRHMGSDEIRHLLVSELLRLLYATTY